MTKRDKKCVTCNTLILRSSLRCGSCAQKKRFENGAWNKGLKRWWNSPTQWIKNDPRISGENAYQWKSDWVGYNKLHYWVVKNLGKAWWCAHCFGCVKVQWANISHEYKRDLNDWMQLCVKCHKKYDKNAGKGHSKLFFNNGRRIAL